MKSLAPFKSILGYSPIRAILLLAMSFLLVAGGVFSLSHQLEHFAAHDEGCLLCHGVADSKVASGGVSVLALSAPQFIDLVIQPLGFTITSVEIALAFWGRAPPFFS